MEASLVVKFIEPLVGGLTGSQLAFLRKVSEENRCAYEFFPEKPGSEERCIESPMDGSRFCEDHVQEYDEYDSWRDREYE